MYARYPRPVRLSSKDQPTSVLDPGGTILR